MKGYYTLLTQLLKDNKCRFVRSGKGSHEVWETQAGKVLIVPHNCYSRHTANKVLQDAGINHKF